MARRRVKRAQLLAYPRDWVIMFCWGVFVGAAATVIVVSTIGGFR